MKNINKKLAIVLIITSGVNLFFLRNYLFNLFRHRTEYANFSALSEKIFFLRGNEHLMEKIFALSLLAIFIYGINLFRKSEEIKITKSNKFCFSLGIFWILFSIINLIANKSYATKIAPSYYTNRDYFKILAAGSNKISIIILVSGIILVGMSILTRKNSANQLEFINNKKGEEQMARDIKKEQQSQTIAQQLKDFKELLDSEIITQEEFDAKKKELLSQDKNNNIYEEVKEIKKINKDNNKVLSTTIIVIFSMLALYFLFKAISTFSLLF